ncbi:hypothetical protein [Streptomyces sp. 3213.3]|uniref:hypothetical protein n=1 Tax=Streptomyces sp. 3213.3 TaxID=1855348 RepID=UPI000B87FE8B|nr:hypothetical protein [Streptomyces sp. 3213.3]
MNDSMPNQPPSDDGEPTSFFDAAKSLLRKNGKFIAGGAILVATGLLVSLANREDGTEGLGRLVSFPDFEDLGRHGVLLDSVEPPSSAPEGSPRKTPDEHWVGKHQRMTKNGPITIDRYKRGATAA